MRTAGTCARVTRMCSTTRTTSRNRREAGGLVIPSRSGLHLRSKGFLGQTICNLTCSCVDECSVFPRTPSNSRCCLLQSSRPVFAFYNSNHLGIRPLGSDKRRCFCGRDRSLCNRSLQWSSTVHSLRRTPQQCVIWKRV